MPRGWEEAVALIAYVFHFPPSEIFDFEFRTLRWWVDRAEWILERLSRGSR